MLYVPPELRLRIDADLANGSPLYVLALEGLSIVAALRELSWQAAVALAQSFMDEQEYAATLIEILSPMASTTRLLPPGSRWSSHASLRVHTETRIIEGSNETEEVVLIDFVMNDPDLLPGKFSSPHTSGRPRLDAAYEEEVAIVRSLSGFSGEAEILLETLRCRMECAAILARAQLFDSTAHRAVVALNSIYSADAPARARIEQFATWLSQLQADEERLEESLRSRVLSSARPEHLH